MADTQRARTVARMSMTAPEVVSAVRRRFGAQKDGYGPEWSALEEFSLGTGGGRQRADLYLVRAWSGRPKGHERILIEVKVSRSDLLHELARPQKRYLLASTSHRMYFATPAGLVKDSDDLGEGVGLLEVHPSGVVRTARKSVRNPTPDDVGEGAFVEAFRRASRAEARVRTAATDAGGGTDLAARVAALEAELTVANRKLATAKSAAARDARRLKDWMTQLAKHGGMPCVCGQPLKTTREPAWGFVHPAGVVCTERWPNADTLELMYRLGLIERGAPIDELPQPGPFDAPARVTPA